LNASTVYEVVTRYRTDDRATASLGRMTGVANELDRANRRAAGSFGQLGSGIGTVVRFLGPLSAGITIVGALAKTFSNLRQEQEATLSVASQFNLAFEFDTDPSKNFLASMRESRGFIRDMIGDAAKLPGELSDFLGALSTMGLPVLTNGGSQTQLRRMLGNLSITAPAAGQNLRDAGQQTMRMLTGQASVGDNPLFAMMTGAGLLPNAASFNTKTAAERLRLLDDAIERFAGNPALRQEVLRTFSTQWGTLMDNVFGVEGILGQLGADPFEAVLDGLTAVNDWLTANKSNFVYYARLFQGGGLPEMKGRPGDETDWSWAWKAFDSVARWFSEQSREGWIEAETRRRVEQASRLTDRPEDRARLHALGMPEGSFLLKSDPLYRITRKQVEGELNFMGPPLPPPGYEPEPKTAPGRKRPKITGDTVTNHITIKVDLRSDDSPEAIAVKLGKAMERASQHPKRAARAPNLRPVPRATR
jgi:hypothetical protein